MSEIDINLNKAECFIKMDSILGTKVTNICEGVVHWVYYPAPMMILSILVTAFAVVGIAFFLLILSTLVLEG